MTEASKKKIQYKVLFRACDKIESVHKATRPFGLSKLQTIKVSFYSIYKASQGFNCNFKIIGDDLSKDLLDFFQGFDNVEVENSLFGSAAKSLQRQIDIGMGVSDDEWIYLCEDDYLHSPDVIKYISEFIENKEIYLKTSSKKKNYINKIVGDLSKLPLIIHPPDYPDRYMPQWKRLSYIFLSKYCHWRQISNTTHTLLLHSSTIKLFENQIKASAIGPSDSVLSKKVYGRFSFRNKAICISPIKGLSTHMTEGVMTPLVNWELLCSKYIDELKKKNVW